MNIDINGNQVIDAAYLVSRGVRCLSLTGAIVENSDKTISDLKIRLNQLMPSGGYPVIPFIYKRPDGYTSYGFAKEPWVIDLFKWVDGPDVPDDYRHMILGLLLGYDPESIRKYFDYDNVLIDAIEETK